VAARKPFLLRIDPDVHEALQKWAEDEFRSLNGHIEYVLRRALDRAGRLPKRSRRDRPSRGDPGGA